MDAPKFRRNSQISPNFGEVRSHFFCTVLWWWKYAVQKFIVRIRDLKSLANGRNNSQLCWSNSVESWCASLHVAKSLTSFKLGASSPINTQQQGVQTDATSNIQQCWELLATNICCVRLNGALERLGEEEVYRGFIPEQMNRKEFKVFDMIRNRLALLPALFFNRQLFIEGTGSRSPSKFLNKVPSLWSNN